MIQLGVGEQQTAWCSIARLPKEMLRAYRESLCNFRSFSGREPSAALQQSPSAAAATADVVVVAVAALPLPRRRNKAFCIQMSPGGRDRTAFI